MMSEEITFVKDKQSLPDSDALKEKIFYHKAVSDGNLSEVS